MSCSAVTPASRTDQGAARVDGERVEDKGLLLGAGARAVLQVGKRKFASVVLG